MQGGGGDDDDLYGGYDEGSNVLAGTTGPSGLDTFAGGTVMPPASAMGRGGPPGTAMMRGPGTAMRGPPGTAMMGPGGGPGTAMRMGTAAADPDARPMTSNKGAGYSSAGPGRPGVQAGYGGRKGSGLPERPEPSAEERARDKEKEVHAILEASAAAEMQGDAARALERAKEAAKKERALNKMREESGLQDAVNVDLTYAVLFNWAQMHHLNRNYAEALNLYEQIVRNRDFQMSGRLRVNMGNIYYEQRKYPNAIKMYRMALDQIRGAADLRGRVLRNIGAAFVRMGSYRDAKETYEKALQEAPDYRIGFNLLVCEYALGDAGKMSLAFEKLLEVPTYEGDEDDELGGDGDDDSTMMADDGLREEIRSRQAAMHRAILLAARLIAPRISHNAPDALERGHDWCIEQLMNRGFSKLAHEMELCKASMCLSQKDFAGAIKVFKSFEMKEPQYTVRAATNLAFLYYLENDLKNAGTYADMAVRSDAYNARALTNRGNVLYARGDLTGAKAQYDEAVQVEVDCVEAIYNLGLVCKALELWDEALMYFHKLRTIIPQDIEVIYQIASLHEILEQYDLAIETFENLHTFVPNDPGVLARLGAVHAKAEDEPKALHYYTEAHRVYPVSMDVIAWLGAFHVKHEAYEAAVPYFELAARVQPGEVKWGLMVASCFRRIGALPAALAKYAAIHAAAPDNLECLRYLIHICTDLGRRSEVEEYAKKLRSAERQAQHTAVAMGTVAGAAEAAPPVAAARAAPAPANRGAGAPHYAEPAFEAPASGTKAKTVVGKAADDEWGDDELGEDLLPM